MLDSTTVYGNVNENILDYSAILEATVKDIQNFLTEFGRVYSFIGEKFPLIEQEMKNENEKSVRKFFHRKAEVSPAGVLSTALVLGLV